MPRCFLCPDLYGRFWEGIGGKVGPYNGLKKWAAGRAGTGGQKHIMSRHHEFHRGDGGGARREIDDRPSLPVAELRGHGDGPIHIVRFTGERSELCLPCCAVVVGRANCIAQEYVQRRDLAGGGGRAPTRDGHHYIW